MTQVDPAVEQAAQRRLAADEERITGSRRTSQTLGQAWRAFWRHPSPWLISALLVGAVALRAVQPGLGWTDLVVPVVLVALFPVIEWVVHVAVLHWRPRRVAGVCVDSLLARKHREHHADPREIPLVFIPWQVELWLLPAYVVVAVVVFPDLRTGATFLVTVGAVLLSYEWVHYLVHSDYRPRSRAYRAVWRNHRLHHYKNEHYWFTVTSAGTADRLFGTYPAVGEVTTSRTVRDLHALESSRDQDRSPRDSSPQDSSPQDRAEPAR